MYKLKNKKVQRDYNAKPIESLINKQLEGFFLDISPKLMEEYWASKLLWHDVISLLY